MKHFHIVWVELGSEFGFCHNVCIDCIFNAFSSQNVGMCVCVCPNHGFRNLNTTRCTSITSISWIHATPNHYFINVNI